MRRALFAAAVACVAIASETAALQQTKPAAPAPTPAGPVVVFTTVKGVIEIETFPADAPKSVERFLDLAKRGFYRGCRFHWVQPAVVQVGDQLTRDMTKRESWGTGGSGPGQSARPIGVFEAGKRPIQRGTVGLAYRNGWKPETADSQIFIMKVANPELNGKYAVLGRVIRGMEVVDKIQRDDMIKEVAVK